MTHLSGVSLDPAVLVDLAPVLRRAVTLDPQTLARVVLRPGIATVLVRLPFGVLVSRTVQAPVEVAADVTVRAAEAIAWLDDGAAVPEARDAEWRTGLPPTSGWTRLDMVPDEVIRPLVRSGALALKDAAAREGVPGAQPRAEVADVLLDATVLTVSDDVGRSVDVSLRAVSALTRMGFLRRDGHAHIDTVGRWVRVVAEYGTVYQERPGGLVLR